MHGVTMKTGKHNLIFALKPPRCTILTACLQNALSQETNIFSVSQKFSRILWKTNLHCRVNNNPVFLPALNHTNPAHILPSYFVKILMSTPSYATKLLAFIFPAQILYSVSPPTRITNPSHITLLYHQSNNSVTSNNYETPP